MVYKSLDKKIGKKSRMMNSPAAQILNFYKMLEKDPDYSWVKWSKIRRRFTEKSANAFFMGVMLDQGQTAERAWDGGEHMVDNFFKKKRNFWKSVSTTHFATVKKICQTGYDGTSYASVFCFKKFPNRLRNASEKILIDYDGDPRNIWNVTSKNVKEIYNRLVEFDGIGDALAKMAQFILVRNYGVAGGIDNRSNMSVKPDELVRRVLFRTGISPSNKIPDSINAIKSLRLPSPADFDAAAWTIGREYCLKTNPECHSCPILRSCQYGKKITMTSNRRKPIR
jgi:endonuclease III